jgi:hypothetical protein
MKFAPLPRAQRTEYRMIKKSGARAESLFAARDGSIHGYKLRSYRVQDLFCSHTSWSGSLWRLSPLGHIS